MTEAYVSRPDPGQVWSSAELCRWYWVKEELFRLARSHGVSASGSKQLLTARIASHLDREEFVEPALRTPAPRRQLDFRLTATSIIPEGQPCSQDIRHWLQEHGGRSYDSARICVISSPAPTEPKRWTTPFSAGSKPEIPGRQRSTNNSNTTASPAPGMQSTLTEHKTNSSPPGGCTEPHQSTSVDAFR